MADSTTSISCGHGLHLEYSQATQLWLIIWHGQGLLGARETLAEAQAYASDLFRLPIITSSRVWILTMVLAIIFGLIAHLFVQRAIHTMDWLDALKTQE